jgi:uncharacterized protein (DUF2267 family)
MPKEAPMLKNIKAFQKTLNEAADWINELISAHEFKDENKAFIALRATLKALRDRITPDEAVHLGSQLPAILRGYYYEGWSPHHQTREKTQSDFIASVKSHLLGHDDIDLEMVVPEALRIIFEKIDKGEAEQVKHNLPKEIQEMCP